MSGSTGAEARRGHIGGRDLPAAIVVGVLLAVTVVAAVVWRAEAFVALVLVLVVAAHLDADRVLRASGRPLLLSALLTSAPVFVLGAALGGAEGQALGAFVLLAVSMAATLLSDERTEVVRRVGETMLFGVWVGVCASYAVRLRGVEEGAVVVLAVIVAVALADVGGYAVGVPFGRHKLAPRVSPNKSWEGLVGGVTLAAVVSAFALPAIGDVFTPATAAAFAVVCAGAGFVGDIGESMLKRDLGVKDLGAVLPGHGGVLDRVDGVLFAMPVAYYAFVLLG